jgi:hypothetical protein
LTGRTAQRRAGYPAREKATNVVDSVLQILCEHERVFLIQSRFFIARVPLTALAKDVSHPHLQMMPGGWIEIVEIIPIPGM